MRLRSVPSSASFREFVIEQLSRVVPRVRSRSMFGGVGIYAGERFFALIANNVLYFKVDDLNRGDYEARDMGPFRPYGDDRDKMQYYEVPPYVLEDADALKDWADKAIGAAERKKRR